MKRVFAVLMAILLLCGCSRKEDGIERAMALRSSLLHAAGCRFEAEITADFGDKTYTFSLLCQADRDGNITFTVLEPEYIAGISGQISYDGGKLTFDDVALAFELQADGFLSPVSAPWVFIKALRGGFIRNCTQEDNLFRMTVDDSYQDDSFMLDIWFNSEDVPIQADIYEDNRRILTIVVHKYEMM